MTTKRKIVASLGIAAPVLGALALYSTTVCSCPTVAQYAVGLKWADADAPALQQMVEKRYPRGMTEADVVERVREAQFKKYCTAESALKTVCRLPHEEGLLARSAAEVSFAWDGAQRLESVAAVSRTRYFWQ